MEITLTADKYDEVVLGADGTVLIDFFATWCMPCQMLRPELEALDEMRDDIEIVSIDVDKTRDLAMKYDIEFVPMVLTFKNGEYLQRFGGFHKKEEMSEMISNVLYKKKDRPKFE